MENRGKLNRTCNGVNKTLFVQKSVRSLPTARPRAMNVILAPTPNRGFGHQFWAAMVGLDAAASFYNATGTEGQVLLDAGFWAEKSFPGQREQKSNRLRLPLVAGDGGRARGSRTCQPACRSARGIANYCHRAERKQRCASTSTAVKSRSHTWSVPPMTLVFLMSHVFSPETWGGWGS